MSEQHKRGSLVWGVVWLSAGCILLLQNLGYPLSFWRIAAKSWPLLLVLAGLGKIFDYYRARSPVSLRFRDVGLVIMILIFGSVATTLGRLNLDPGTWRFPIHMGKRSVTFRDLWKNSYTYEEEGTHEMAADRPLVVDNAYGTVEINAGAVEEVKVRLKKVIYEDSESRAKDIAQRIRLVFQEDGKQLKVKTNWQELQGLVARCETNLIITVPKQSRCKVENRNGEVKVSGLVGDQEVYCSGGAVSVNDIKGAVKIENKNKDTHLFGITGNVEALCSNSRLLITRIEGDVEVRNTFARSEVSDVEGKVTIRDKESTVQVERVKKEVSIDAPQSAVLVRNVKGAIKINAPYNRPIRVEDVQAGVTITSSNGQAVARNVKGTLTIESKYGDLRVADIQGPLTITAESSAVQAEAIKGVTTIRTTLKDVLVNAVENQTTIQNKYGDITLAAGTRLHSNLDITNENGKIDLVLPENSNFKITGLARGGGLESQFEGPQLDISRDGDESIRGSFGTGGPTIKLETTHETITIRKGTEVEVRVPKDWQGQEPRRGKRKKSKQRREITLDRPGVKEWAEELPAVVRAWRHWYDPLGCFHSVHDRSSLWLKN